MEGNTNVDWTDWHGFKGKTEWPLPKLVARSDQANRADQKNMIKANEYLDELAVLDAKLDVIGTIFLISRFMQMVVQMLKQSNNCVTYTGAGLSRASGIPDYATKSKESIVAVS